LRSDGRYTARFTYNKVPYQAYFQSEQEAVEWLERKKYEVKYGGSVSDKKSRKTVEELSVDWLDDVSLRQTTIATYAGNYRQHIKPVIGHMLVTDVTPADCKKVFKRMAQHKYSRSTYKQVRIAMHLLFARAVDDRLISHNPVTDNVKIPSVEHIKRREPRHLYITPDERERFFAVAKGTYVYNFCRLGIATGMRIAELMGLSWENVDFDTGYIYVKRALAHIKRGGWDFTSPKSEAGERKIPMTAEIRAILEDAHTDYTQRPIAKDKRFRNLVFFHEGRSGLPVDGSTYDAKIQRVCKRAGIAPFTAHAMRHTFITDCYNAGVDVKVIQRIAGHSSISTTMDVYVETTSDMVDSEIQKLIEYKKKE